MNTKNPGKTYSTIAIPELYTFQPQTFMTLILASHILTTTSSTMPSWNND